MSQVADQRLQTLELRHRALDEQVTRLERRAYLTPTEQREMAELKKQKLIAKDQIAQARRG